MNFLKISSILFGIVAKFHFFNPLQKLINKAYVNHFNINLSEFKQVEEYKSLNELFTRKLLKNRELQDGFISPCDGKVLESLAAFFQQNELFALSIKGRFYNIYELLTDNFEKIELENGADFVNIYLSPKDYHRYHSPCDMQILSAKYTSGKLHSVNEKHLFKIANLYSQNERVSLKCKSKQGDFIFWLVFVGAQNVGKMNFCFDKSIQTNALNSLNFKKEYENLHIKKGEELGNFELGSTIVIISQKDKLKFNAKQNQNIKFGDKIADFNEM